MTVAPKASPQSIRPGRWTFLAFVVCATAVLSLFSPHPARAQGYAVGQRTQCDATGLHSNYRSGVVIATHPGETFNGYAAGSGYFYRVRIDGGDPEGTLCKAEDMRAAQAAAPAAAARPQSAATRVTASPPAARAAAARPAPVGGNRFGTRDARHCAPVRTKPTLEQIRALVQCDYESASDRERNLIYLDQNLMVQVGGTRPYSQFQDGYATGIDTTAQVIPITGSADTYQCAALSKYTNTGTVYDTDNTGKNCAVAPVRQVQGKCYRRTVGDWLCKLEQGTTSSVTKLNQPPPG
jgi:hypothetical protein